MTYVEPHDFKALSWTEPWTLGNFKPKRGPGPAHAWVMSGPRRSLVLVGSQVCEERDIMSIMESAIRPNRAVLEESPEYFWERFSRYAQAWPVCPEPLGSPLLEVLTPLGPLYAFDRTLVPFSGSEIPIIVHGQVEHWEATQDTNALKHLGGGRYQMSGRVEAVLDATFFVLHVQGSGGESSLQVVLAASSPPGVGSWITAHLNPPLMVFRPDSYSR